MSLAPADRLTQSLRDARTQRVGLVAFLTAGFPSKESFRADLTDVAAHADVVEIGVPFTDPMADGVTIQRSSMGALAQGVTLHWIINELADMPPVKAPLVLMSYTNPLLAYGLDALAADGRFLGGLIVPGYDLMRSALARGTARLPVAAGRFDPFPRSTDDAIVTGALQAMAGAVSRTRDAMLAAGEAAPQLVLTGGSAPLLLPVLEGFAPLHVPSLVLEGVLVLVQDPGTSAPAGDRLPPGEDSR
jgi:hypothetical protein